MASVQQQLEEYRARKRKEKPLDSPLSIKSLTNLIGRNSIDQNGNTSTSTSDVHQTKDSELCNALNEQEYSPKWYYSILGLKIILWFLLWGFFIETGFGAVYFAISLLYLMYTSLGSGKRKRGEPSAYSVFNPDCERLEGTFTAEQFEKELRFGAGAF